MSKDIKTNKELRKAIGHAFLVLATSIVIFLLVDSKVDESKAISTTSTLRQHTRG